MSKIYGSPLWLSGGGGTNDTLPPLLDNFKATRSEGNITLSASKMEESRAKDLAGAVWVYGEHIPQNKNDGVRIELTREEIVMADKEPFITLADIPASDAKTETIVNLKESDGQLHPYIYLHNNYENSSAGLLLRKEIIGNAKMSNANYDGCPIDTSIVAFKNGLPTNIQDNLVDVDLRIISSRTILRSAFALSMSELATNGSTGDGTSLPYFNVNYETPSEKRIVYKDDRPVMYWTRTSSGTNGFYVDTDGRVLFDTVTISLGVRPAICLKTSFKLSVTPNKDGSYDMYEDSLVKTRASGKTVGDLASKSKVKLGRYAGQELQWLVCRNAEKKLFLILAAESMGVLGNKMFDNAEPSNPEDARRNGGNNRYIYSNIHQWLNSDKSANNWYTKSHTYDAPPDYTNQDGFLKNWTIDEIQMVSNATWVTKKSDKDGGGTESFQSKITLPSSTEMGLISDTGGSKLDIFNSDSDRAVSGKYYWCRTAESYPSYVQRIDYNGKLLGTDANLTVYQVRPICSIPESTHISENPDSDGCYTLVFNLPLERTVAWDKSKNFYARQFTYNSQNQYQTMLEGAIASPDIIPDGQELSKLPSKSKVKLGKFNGQALKWLVCRDSVDQSLRLILDGESMAILGSKMFDNAEPKSSDSAVRDWGSSRYIWSNIRQWLNSYSPANSWYVAQHNDDTPPDYINVVGFLHEWTEKEINILENANWTITRHNLYGGGTESFQNKIVLPSSTEMGLENNTGGARIDIFNNNEDRIVTGTYYWLRTPWLVFASHVRRINLDGTLNGDGANKTIYGIRPLCKPIPTTLVSLLPDSDGCYTLV